MTTLRLLYTFLRSSTNVQVFHYNLTGKHKCKSHPLKANSIKKFTSIPGLLLLHTNKGVALLHPGMLELIKMELKGSTYEAAGDGDGGEDMQYQFDVEDALFSVVKVWDVESCLNDAADASEGKFTCIFLPLSLTFSLPLSLPLSLSSSVVHIHV